MPGEMTLIYRGSHAADYNRRFEIPKPVEVLLPDSKTVIQISFLIFPYVKVQSVTMFLQ